jgi:hypothetical protein
MASVSEIGQHWVDELFHISEEPPDFLKQSSDIIENILAHHGVKGQKWGVRTRVGDTALGGLGLTTPGGRARSAARAKSAGNVIVRDKGKKLKTSGGAGHPAHSDAVRARTSGQIAKKSGLKALSDAQLREFNNRLNLEQQAKRLTFNDASPPKRFALTLLGQTGKQQASETANAVVSKQVKKVLASG